MGTSSRSKIELAPELIEWMAERSAFLYSELLPISALKPSGKNGKDDKPYFSKAEDNIIALGKSYDKARTKFRSPWIRLNKDLASDDGLQTEIRDSIFLISFLGN